MFKNRKKSLQLYVFSNYFLLAILLVFCFMAVFLATDITGDLERNNYKYYYSKIEQKRIELEYQMLNVWGNPEALHVLSERILENYYSGQDRKQTDVNMTRTLVDMMLSTNVSGAGIFMNPCTEEARAIYVKNNNYLNFSPVKSNVSLSVGSLDLAKELGISVSDEWEPKISGKDGISKELMGYVVTRLKEQHDPYFYTDTRLDDHVSLLLFKPVFDKSEELVAVICFELSDTMLTHYLSYIDLSASKRSGYAVGRQNLVYSTFENVFINGPYVEDRLFQKELNFRKVQNKNFITYSGSNYIAYSVDEFIAIVLPLRLYPRTSMVNYADSWVFIGYIPADEFYVYSNTVKRLVMTLAVVTLFISVLFAYIISHVLMNPVRKITQQTNRLVVEQGGTPFQPLAISEYDELEEHIEDLIVNVRESQQRLFHVFSMINQQVIIIEQNLEKDFVYKYSSSDDFLNDVFGEDLQWPLPMEVFRRLMNELYADVRFIRQGYGVEQDSDFRYYEIFSNKRVRNVKYKTIHRGNTIYHFAIDCTSKINANRKLEYEVEYDTETSLLNREVFKKKVSEYIDQKMDSKGAMVMWRLDDLEYIRIAYGYDIGDKCLKVVANELASLQNQDIDFLVSRFSGDKFMCYIPFGHMKKKVLELLNNISSEIMRKRVYVDKEVSVVVKVSKGISWYPGDSLYVDDLCIFSEYALNSAVRNSQHTNFEFSRESYKENIVAIRQKEQFEALLEERDVDFAFQPIVDIHSGEVLGYEALMRVITKFKDVEEIQKVALAHGKMPELELLTMASSVQKIKKNLDYIQDKIVFINSVRDVYISDDLTDIIFGAENLPRIVIDISGMEKMENNIFTEKIDWVKNNDFGLCLDDFGYWYSSKQLLNQVSADFLKIDVEIIRNVDRDKIKQQTVIDVVAIAKETGVRVIAEGVETIEEMRFLKSVGVEYAQGNLLAEPSLEVTDFVYIDVTEV